MYAVGLVRYGGPEVLQVVELPTPRPAPGQVRVKVRAAGINPVDVMVRDGSLSKWSEGALPPYVPGMDIMGTVDEIGEGIPPELAIALGTEVAGIVDNYGSYGGYSQYVCLPAGAIIPVPTNAPYPAAGSFLMNALTARCALDTLGLPAKSTVLVTGAAGAVGAYTIALGNDQGLQMVAVAASQDETFLRATGASHVVVRADDVADRVRNVIADGVDAVVDAACLGVQILPAVRDRGTLIRLRPDSDSALERGIRSVFINVRERSTDHDALMRLGQQVESGLLPLRVAATFPATDAVAAHRLFARGNIRGRVILDFQNL